MLPLGLKAETVEVGTMYSERSDNDSSDSKSEMRNEDDAWQILQKLIFSSYYTGLCQGQYYL